MTRIIPEEINKILKKEYRLRFFTLLFFILSLLVVVNLTFVSSSYLLLHLYEKAYATNNSDSNNEGLKLSEQVKNKTEELYSLSQKIETPKKSTGVQVASNLLAYTQNSVSIQALEILEDSKITIRGVAGTRQDLIEYQARVSQNPMFKDFSVPIETLARQRDVAFTVTFTYYEN